MLKNLSISIRLHIMVAGTAALVLVVFFSSWLSYRSYREYDTDIASYRSMQEEIRAWKDVQLDVANVWQFFTDASLTRDQKVIDEEAKPNYDHAMQTLDRIAATSPGQAQTVAAIKADIVNVWSVGGEMFRAYSTDWNQGNAVMDRFDQASDRMIKGVAAVVDKMKTRDDAAVAEMAAMTQASIRKTMLLVSVVGLCGVMAIVVSLAVKKSIANPLITTLHVSEQVAAGNLAVAIVVDRSDEMGKLLAAMKDMVGRLKNVVSGITTTASGVAVASDQLSSSSLQISSTMAENQDKFLQFSSATTQMAQSVHEIAVNAANIADVATRTTDVARQGREIVGRTLEEVRDMARSVHSGVAEAGRLQQASQQIGDIIALIQDIADQTNLLALNASIEAARAGEQGRGFAVVADEVRKLATGTADATRKITGSITEIQSVTKAIVDAMASIDCQASAGEEHSLSAAASIDSIIEEIGGLADLVCQISSATEEISQVAEEVGNEIVNISSASAEAASGAVEVAKSSESLNGMAKELQGMVLHFQT